MNDIKSLSHTSWNCKYHIVFAQKYSVSSVMRFLKGKGSININSKWGYMKYKDRNREFWYRGYYVNTVGKNTKKIKEYIANQLKDDQLGNQFIIEDMTHFKGG